MSVRMAVLIAAAGAGSRMGGVRKQFLELAGEPILVHALRPFLAHPDLVLAVVALPAEEAMRPPTWLTELDPRIRIVAGGAQRGDSIRRALDVVPEDVDVVLVHDAARPLVSASIIDRVVTAAAGGHGAVAGIPVVDTLKVVDPAGRVVATEDRARFRRAQTPQGFPRPMLMEAYRRAEAEGTQGTDDAALVENCGASVVIVDDTAENFKVTSRGDLQFAEAILRLRST